MENRSNNNNDGEVFVRRMNARTHVSVQQQWQHAEWGAYLAVMTSDAL